MIPFFPIEKKDFKKHEKVESGQFNSFKLIFFQIVILLMLTYTS